MAQNDVRERSKAMVSWASSAAVRKSMVSNRGRDTSLEVKLRSALHRRGLRFWKNRRPVPALRCNADIVFPRQKVAVFVNGCFWHGCPDHATWPVKNADFWKAKIEGNKERDAVQDLALAQARWTVIRLWEHEPIDVMVESVTRALRASRDGDFGEIGHQRV